MKCIMGCVMPNGHSLHLFPRDVKRRAEWCRILGINPRKRRIYLCGAHFPDYYIMGHRVSRHAIPNPPETLRLVDDFSTSYDDSITEKVEKDVSNLSEEVQILPNEEENTTEQQKSPEKQETKIEDFEIRKGNNNDMIIKGRFIQTDNYLMVSYTPPKKWSLQQQVSLLDTTCTSQLRQIKKVNRENHLLRTELKKYEKLLPKLRFLQTQNRFLYSQIKMFKLKEKADRKRKMKGKHRDVTSEHDSPKS